MENACRGAPNVERPGAGSAEGRRAGTKAARHRLRAFVRRRFGRCRFPREPGALGRARNWPIEWSEALPTAMTYFLGVDGGQSGTTAVIGDESGQILGTGQAGPCNHAAVHEGRAKLERAVTASVAAACGQIRSRDGLDA